MSDSKNLSLKTNIGVIHLLPKSQILSEEDLMFNASYETKSYAMQVTSLERRSEFLRSRWLLRQISNLEDPKRLSEGNVDWPSGFMGSISHKEGQVALVFEKKTNFDSIGIDLEKITVNQNILTKVGTPHEVDVIKKTNPDFCLEETSALLFSAKEAIYKAVFPVVQRKFWFDQARLDAGQMQDGLLKLEFSICETVVGIKNKNIKVEISKINLDQKDFWIARCGYTVEKK